MVQSQAISFTSHLPVSFRRDTKSRWSLLSGVYARGSQISHTGGKYVTCSGLTNSRKDNSCVSASLGCLEETTEKYCITILITFCLDVPLSLVSIEIRYDRSYLVIIVIKSVISYGAAFL